MLVVVAQSQAVGAACAAGGLGECMVVGSQRTRSWLEALRLFVHPRVVTMLFLGFSAGIPILLIFSSLSLWLREAGADRAEVTFFSWAALAYSFKFVWAPLVDRLPIPFITGWLGRRRGWLLLAQISVIGSIVWMAMIDPGAESGNLTAMAWAAVVLGFSSATQDIVIDAYRIESAETELQAMMSSSYIAGYRIAMIVAGAGALFLASFFGTEIDAYHYTAWKYTYLAMALTMFIGVVTTLAIDEPKRLAPNLFTYSNADYIRFLLLFICGVSAFVTVFFMSGDLIAEYKSAHDGNPAWGFFVETVRLFAAVLAAFLVVRFAISCGMVNRMMVRESYLAPLTDFLDRYGFKIALLLLALIGFYRISDIVLGVISNVFYQDLGFSKNQIAAVVKTFGLIMTIAGGFLGGLLSVRYGVMPILFLGALLTVLTNLLFMVLAYAGNDMSVLYLVISADNLSAGLASAAFVAFLSSLTSVSFTAVQYAIFSSLMTLLPKLIGGYSGTMVEAMGYSNFFLLASVLGLPVLGLVWLAGRMLGAKEPQ